MAVHLFVFTLLAWIAPQLFPGVKVKGGWTALMVAVVFGFLNLFLGWLVTAGVALVSLPLLFLTGGLFKVFLPMIINAVLLRITEGVLKDFSVRGWAPAFGMGFLFAIGGVIVRAL